MPHRLPPLSALRAFEAAARHGSFKRAAQELAVTPTAISHQIRTLEDHVGLALFERLARGVTLTEEGARIFPVFRDGFAAFSSALGRVAHRRGRGKVIIAATTAFTARWLIPRVPGFRAAHPQIDLQLEASEKTADIQGGEVDIAIRYGSGPYPDFDVEPLLSDRFAPLCHPTLSPATVAEMAGRPLIDFRWQRRRPDNPTWERWFAEAGLSMPDDRPRLHFSDETHAIQAAVAGQGIVLASLALVRDELEGGKLIQPFALAIPGFCYHLLTRSGENDPAVVAVCHWLRVQAEPFVE